MLRTAALAGQPNPTPGSFRAAMDEFATFGFQTPRARLLSAATGAEVSQAEHIGQLLTAELLDARLAPTQAESKDAMHQRLADAVRIGSVGASLLLQTAKDRDLTRAISQSDGGYGGAGQRRKVPVVSIDGDPADDRALARAAAALFVVGALTRPEQLYQDRPARPIDIWREQSFISHPCQTRPAAPQAELPPRQRRRPAAGQPADPSRRPAQPPTDREPKSIQSDASRTDTSPTDASRTDTSRTSTSLTDTRRPMASLMPWSRCYVAQTRPVAGLTLAPEPSPSQVYLGGCEPFRPVVDELFRHQQGADRTVAVLGELSDDRTIEQAAAAAHSAIGTGRLVAISPDAGLLGFWATLHAEHPDLGIVAVQAALTAASLHAASQLVPVAGEHLELAIGPDGSLAELLMVPIEPQRGGDFPLGPDDVVLLSRAAGAAGAALAQVLACSGAAIAVIGHEHPRPDDVVTDALDQLRQAGVAVVDELVDPASASALAAAIGRIEARLGKVTAVANAVPPTGQRPIARLAPAELPAEVAAQARALEQLVTAVRDLDGSGQPGCLKLIATFGSVTGRYGLANASTLALASGVLASYAERLAAASPGCRAVHVAWPTWAGADLGERPQITQAMELAGYTPMSVAAGSRQLLKLLGADNLPTRLAIHGRVGEHAPRPIALAASAQVTGRFIERVLVHYPDAELVAEATISPATDPYLGEYLIDGVGLMPPLLAVEALAQAASALAGRPLRIATDVAMTAPIVLADQDAQAVLRIYAQRDDGCIKVVLRCDSTGFAVDHFRATFDCTVDVSQNPGLARLARLSRGEPSMASVPAATLYESVCFQTGRLQVLTSADFAGPSSVTGIADLESEAARQPWFTAAVPELLLGQAAVIDSALQLTQACLPHRRLLFGGCDIAEFAGGVETAGLVTVRAVQVDRTPAGNGLAAIVPKQRTGRAGDATASAADSFWNVEAVDATGRLVLRLLRLRLRDAGPLPWSTPWPLPLAACLLERAGNELGLGPELQVRISRRAGAMTGLTKSGWMRAAADGALSDYVLLTRASGLVAASWRVVPSAPPPAERAEPWLGLVNDAGISAADGARWALANAVASCAGTPTMDDELVVQTWPVAGANWLLIRAGHVRIAGLLLDLAEVDQPVAIAIMTGTIDRAERTPAARRQAQPASHCG